MKMKWFLGVLLSLALVLGLLPGMSLTALALDGNPYAGLLNTAKVVRFDGKEWYLIEDHSKDNGTVTLFSKECVAASKFGSNNNNAYANSTVKVAVDDYYTNSISNGAKSAVSGSEMFLLTADQADAIQEKMVKLCSPYPGTTNNRNIWWLSSAGVAGANSAACVAGDNGNVNRNGLNVGNVFGVRPALRLDLSAVTFSSVNLSGGANAVVDGGSTSQSFFDLGSAHSAMTAVTYTAEAGYEFPETSDCYKEKDGITVSRTSATVVTVSGTPNGVVDITVPDAVHAHSFTYSADGAAITATCTAVGCTLDDGSEQHNHAVGLAIAAPALTTYGGAESPDAILTGLDDFNAATGKAIAAADIKYYKATKDGDTYTRGGALNAAPTDAGDYMAEITLTGVKTGDGDNKSVTASVGYSIAKIDPVAAAPTDVTATYGQMLADVTLTNPTGNTPGTWAWEDSASTVGSPGKHTFKASFTPTDATNYNGKADVDVTVKVARADAVPATVTANNRNYDGKQKPLVIVDNSTLAGGQMQYAFGADATTAPADEKYSTFVPTATDAGTYYVWYKVVGDENHNSTEPVKLEVTISPADKAALNKAIAAAKEYCDSIKDYTDIAAALKTAIDAAEKVAKNDNVTEADIAAAISTLNGAVDTAKADVKKADDEAAAKKVVDAINALPDNACLDDKPAVEAARAAYDALTDDQKKLVPEDVLAKLIDAEDQVKAEEEGDDGETAKINIAKCKITAKNRVYTGNAITPRVTVKYNDKTLKAGTDYTLSYSKNLKAIGTAKVTVKGIGKFTGSRKVSFRINPKGTSLGFIKVNSSQGKMTLKWIKRQNITGYQIEYSMKVDFQDPLRLNVRKTKHNVTIRNLEGDTTYYVRIRTFRKVDKKVYFSAWSSTKVAKTEARATKNEAEDLIIDTTMNADVTLDLEFPDITDEIPSMDDLELPEEMEIELTE